MWSDAMSTLAKMYPKLSAVELSAILMKGAAISASLERDSGFNSGSSEHEDDLKSLDQSSRDGLISPENSSEDSVPEAKLPASTVVTTQASSLVKNKRKSTEPLRVVAETELLAPLKKRIRFDDERKHVEDLHHHRQDREELDTTSPVPSCRTESSPFRPWAPSAMALEGSVVPLPVPFVPPFHNPADLLVRHPAVTTLHRAVSIKPLEQLQPLALVAKKSGSSCASFISKNQSSPRPSPRASSRSPQRTPQDWKELQEQHGHLHTHTPSESLFVQPRAPPSLDDTNDSITDHETSATSGGHGKSSIAGGVGSQTRNYKNMTRERRIEANARERTRVHTISAAYEKLRRAIPAYSNAQKLSKLSILRIACSYILTLSRMAGEDYSEDGSEPSIADCVEMVTRTIQTEGKIRKKKDE
ncbi:transcription factor Atoh8 [Anopheles funestus]|uniref:transcription factor Atoh8 n=1 Tax=Anopheles funestus TaxID=62324 RepID=UPI0020C6894D|nr:transcription factor Atoh8 [Anopheles funestus]